tara:strand:- start:12347 stop:13672 length:1326 start_codon:yes stop_codon:yes gene_type:complete
MFDDIKPPEGEEDSKEVPSGGHSIRDVTPVTTQERQTRRARRAERRTLANAVGIDNRNRKTSNGKFAVWAIAILVLVVAFSAVGFVFIGKTTITIVPQQEEVNLSANVVYTAYRDAEEGELSYTLLTYTIESTDNIAATGRETVEEKASGRIVVYNNHGPAPQRLIKNTRFEAPNGEIYRVRNSFVVPGMSGDTPGSIEITVYADKPGEDQNISDVGTRFTIPGLKGDPRYDTFYAELKEPITGGFVGERAIVDEDILNAVRTQLRSQLRDQVESAVAEQASETTEVFAGGIFTTFESMQVTYSGNDTATVREVARINAVAFEKNELARMLATAALANPEDGDILIDNPENLTMKIVNKDGVDIVDDALIQFTLEGRSTLTWQVDIEGLKQDLVGKNSGALNTVMSGYPGIKSAQATIRPFWKSEFPSETGGISVEVVPES